MLGPDPVNLSVDMLRAERGAVPAWNLTELVPVDDVTVAHDVHVSRSASPNSTVSGATPSCSSGPASATDTAHERSGHTRSGGRQCCGVSSSRIAPSSRSPVGWLPYHRRCRCGAQQPLPTRRMRAWVHNSRAEASRATSTRVKPEASRAEVEPKIHRWPRQRPRLTPEMATFLLVGGTGYVVDVLALNLLRSYGPLVQADPT